MNNKPIKIEKEQDHTIVNLNDDYTYCHNCDDYFLDDERCECEEG